MKKTIYLLIILLSGLICNKGFTQIQLAPFLTLKNVNLPISGRFVTFDLQRGDTYLEGVVEGGNRINDLRTALRAFRCTEPAGGYYAYPYADTTSNKLLVVGAFNGHSTSTCQTNPEQQDGFQPYGPYVEGEGFKIYSTCLERGFTMVFHNTLTNEVFCGKLN